MKKSQARGYLLESVLAKLIEINGYELIRKDDGNEIVKRNNGLNVKGRGGYHQFDTLGKFKITPPFVYPIRLFVEATFYSSKYKVGIDRVRMGVGILEDINTNYSTIGMGQDELLLAKYHYYYAIFSTSGFTEAAQRYAIAHKIHLIDLTGREYKPLLDLIDNIVNDLDNQSPGPRDNISNDAFAQFKSNFDSALFSNSLSNDYADDKIIGIETWIRDKDIYLATINSPYLVPLLADKRIKNKLLENPHQRVGLIRNDGDWNWTLVSVFDADFTLTFKLPNLLREYMRFDSNLAQTVKEKFIYKFSFFAFLEGNDPTLCTLTYDKDLTDNFLRNTIE